MGIVKDGHRPLWLVGGTSRLRPGIPCWLGLLARDICVLATAESLNSSLRSDWPGVMRAVGVVETGGSRVGLRGWGLRINGKCRMFSESNPHN